MKILLIDPPGEQAGINAGLAYLSGALGARGIEHLVLDMVNGDAGDEVLLRVAAENKPSCFGLSVKTATYRSSVHIAKVLKESFPEAPILAGGPHSTLYGDELLAEVPEIDAVLCYDSEASLPELLSAWDCKGKIPDIGGLLVRSPGGVRSIPPVIPADLDELPLPDFDCFSGLDLLKHPYPLVTSRGCPHGCIYCSVGKVSGKKWRYRSPSSVIDELERARNRWGFFEFDVLDDTFTHNVDRAMEICSLMMARNLNMKWSCPNGIRADRTTPELLQNMAKAGCHTVIFGVESGNPEVFAGLRKGEKLSDVERAVRFAKDARLRVGGYFIIGLPGDTYEGTMSSLEYAQKIGLDWAHFNLLAPYPGTRIWDIIKEKGRFLDDWRATRHFGTNPRPIFELDNYSIDDMIRAYRTVHARQRLFHLLLPAGMDEKKKKKAIRRLRIQYDREGWMRDVLRDAHKILKLPETLAKIAAHEVKLSLPIPQMKHKSRARAADRAGMRVMMVNDHGPAAGGTERYIRDIMLELKTHDIEVAWSFEKQGNWDGIEAPRYPVRGLWDSDIEPDILRDDLEAAIMDFGPDLIHIHNIQSPAAMKICLKHAPTIRTVHDHNFTCPSMNRMWATGGACALPAGFACMDKLLDGGCMILGKRPLTLMPRLEKVLDGLSSSKKLDKILVASEFMGKELIANGADSSRVLILPLYVDFPDNFDINRDETPLRILWAGRMVIPDKGPDLFLDVLSRLRGKWVAVMAGTGPAEEFLRRKAAELGLIDRVEFAGQLDSSGMDQMYRRSHVVAFTSVWPEPFGYVGVEAAAHARPVVAFGVGAVREWLPEGEGGFIVPRGHADAMKLWIDSLARDPELRYEMGLKNRRHALEKFTKERHIEKLLEIYSEVAVK